MSRPVARALSSAALLFLITALPRPARAEASAADQAAAQSLFEQARKLMDAGQAERACPKLVESQRLDPGIGTMFNLGLCYETAGQTASSYGAFGEAAVMARNAGDKARQAAAEQLAKAMETKLSRLLIRVVADPRPAGMTVKRDGREVAEALFDTAIPVDPGEHAIEASAPGKKTWTATARVPKTAGVVTAEIPALEDAPTVAAGAAKGEWWSTQRKVSVGVAGAGVVGLVVGSVFGAQALSKYSDSKAHCQAATPNVCSAEGIALRGSAGTAADVSTVSMIAGGVLLAGGVVLFVTAPSGDAGKSGAARIKVAPMMTSRVGGLLLQGEW